MGDIALSTRLTEEGSQHYTPPDTQRVRLPGGLSWGVT